MGILLLVMAIIVTWGVYVSTVSVLHLGSWLMLPTKWGLTLVAIALLTWFSRSP